MITELYCNNCNKHMATLRDAKVRNGIVVYCAECNNTIEKYRSFQAGGKMPDFMSQFFRK